MTVCPVVLCVQDQAAQTSADAECVCLPWMAKDGAVCRLSMPVQCLKGCPAVAVTYVFSQLTRATFYSMTHNKLSLRCCDWYQSHNLTAWQYPQLVLHQTLRAYSSHSGLLSARVKRMQLRNLLYNAFPGNKHTCQGTHSLELLTRLQVATCPTIQGYAYTNWMHQISQQVYQVKQLTYSLSFVVQYP